MSDLQHVVRVLQHLLGQVPLALDLDVERFRNVRHDQVDQPTHAEDDVLKIFDTLKNFTVIVPVLFSFKPIKGLSS